jgi:hypothetical protein
MLLGHAEAFDCTIKLLISERKKGGLKLRYQKGEATRAEVHKFSISLGATSKFFALMVT